MFARWGNVLVGVWLVIAPWILMYGDAGAARTNDLWIGLAIIAVALVGTRVPGFRFINSALGVWLVMAPFVLVYPGVAPVFNDVIVGMVVLGLSLVPSIRRSDIRRRATVTP